MDHADGKRIFKDRRQRDAPRRFGGRRSDDCISIRSRGASVGIRFRLKLALLYPSAHYFRARPRSIIFQNKHADCRRQVSFPVLAFDQSDNVGDRGLSQSCDVRERFVKFILQGNTRGAIPDQNRTFLYRRTRRSQCWFSHPRPHSNYSASLSLISRIPKHAYAEVRPARRCFAKT
jgi:hypothetical protein